MKAIFNKAVRQYLRLRYRRIVAMQQMAPQLQEAVLSRVIKGLQSTEYAKKHSIKYSMSMAKFQEIVPLVEYVDIYPYIQRMMQAEPNILCKGKVKRFAKSSGTTNDRSKYIPMPWHYHSKNHVAASWDTMSIVYHEDSEAKIFEKKSLIMGGSMTNVDKVLVGDVSAILLDKMHWAGRPFFTPDFKTACLPDWEEKIDRMVTICKNEPIVMFGGVPTWSLVLCNRILEATGKSNMHEVWPDVRYYMHGGVSFLPYRDQFKELFPDPSFKYYEVYNASEGYFAVQDKSDTEGMLLLVNNEIFYEFIPIDNLETTNPTCITLAEVQVGEVYAMVITTSAGLWRYIIGDTVTFTSITPYRIMVVGRTKQSINVFGEEVMVANTDKALMLTLDLLSAKVNEYTVAPNFMSTKKKGSHHWIIEFEREPVNVDEFALALDNNLRSINSDYDAKRSKDLALDCLKVEVVAKGTFHRWMKAKGKIGGQNKVPRLSNNRKLLNEILSIARYGNN